MIVSAVLAFILPFELFLFSYAVLGPLHYLTEIGWLHKKNYFAKGKYDFLFLSILCVLVFYFSFVKPTTSNTKIPHIIFYGLLISFIFSLVSETIPLYFTSGHINSSFILINVIDERFTCLVVS